MKDEREHLPEHDESLWWLAAGPAIWFAHFMLSYVTAAVACAKFSAVSGARGAIAIYTLFALSAIAVIAWRSWPRHRSGNAHLPHDEDTREDRHRFLGFATLLLCGLSVVAVAYVALVPVFIGDCR